MTLSQQTLQAMRDWIADCTWADIDSPEDIADLSDEAVIRGIKRHYSGGIEQFLKDCSG